MLIVGIQTTIVKDRRAKAAVRLLRRLTPGELAYVIILMPELRAIPAELPTRDSTENYWQRVLREERGGYQPSLSDECLDGLTYRE